MSSYSIKLLLIGLLLDGPFNIHSWNDIINLMKSQKWELSGVAGILHSVLMDQVLLEALKKKGIVIKTKNNLIEISNECTTLVEYVLQSMSTNLDILYLITEFSEVPPSFIQKIENPVVFEWYLNKFPGAISQIIDGQTILFSPNCTHHTIQLMLNHKIDPNAHSSNRMTPLHHHILMHENAKIPIEETVCKVQALLNVGANPHIRNLEGKTPIDLATNIPELIKLFGNPLLKELSEWAKPIEIQMGSEPEKIFATLYKFLTYEQILEMETKFEQRLCPKGIMDQIPFNYAVDNQTPDKEAVIEHVLQKYQ